MTEMAEGRRNLSRQWCQEVQGRAPRRMRAEYAEYAKRSHKDRKGSIGLNGTGNIKDLGKCRFNGVVMGMMEEEGKEIDKVSTVSVGFAVTGKR